MERLLIRPKLDIVFKKFFTDKDNVGLLKDLLSNVLKIPAESIQEIVVENNEVLPENLSDKFCRLDLHVTVDGRNVDVEMEVSDRGNYKERSLYYWSRLYGTALPRGHQYEDLPQTILISFLDFNLFDCDSYHSEFGVLEKTRGEILTDKFEMHFFEMKKLSGTLNREDKMELWLRFLGADTDGELEVLGKAEDKTMEQAVLKIRQMSKDELLREQARIRQETQWEEASALGYAERKGVGIGVGIGVTKGKFETVLGMLKKGLGISLISECSSIPEADILKFARENGIAVAE